MVSQLPSQFNVFTFHIWTPTTFCAHDEICTEQLTLKWEFLQVKPICEGRCKLMVLDLVLSRRCHSFHCLDDILHLSFINIYFILKTKAFMSYDRTSDDIKMIRSTVFSSPFGSRLVLMLSLCAGLTMAC